MAYMHGCSATDTRDRHVDCASATYIVKRQRASLMASRSAAQPFKQHEHAVNTSSTSQTPTYGDAV